MIKKGTIQHRRFGSFVQGLLDLSPFLPEKAGGGDVAPSNITQVTAPTDVTTKSHNQIPTNITAPTNVTTKSRQTSQLRKKS